MQNVVIIDYGSGNLHSAAKSFECAARGGSSSSNIIVSSRAEDVARADRIVLPGVGAYADCKQGLDAVPGMRAALEDAVRIKGRPFLGICVGMQLLAERGREFETVDGLGWIKGEVVPLAPRDPSLKIPHMGWNELAIKRRHPVLQDIEDRAHAYFVHSFGFKPADPADLIAEVEYGGPVAAVIGRDNILGVQFHPEKSQATGLKLIANFLRWRP